MHLIINLTKLRPLVCKGVVLKIKEGSKQVMLWSSMWHTVSIQYMVVVWGLILLVKLLLSFLYSVGGREG